jgi:hypothetical protein
MKRVTDLDKLALEEIWRPYATLAGCGERLDRIPVSLEETARLLAENKTEWSRCVLKRIADIGFWFPDYVRHPLVDAIKAASTRPAATKDGSGDEADGGRNASTSICRA